MHFDKRGGGGGGGGGRDRKTKELKVFVRFSGAVVSQFSMGMVYKNSDQLFYCN